MLKKKERRFPLDSNGKEGSLSIQTILVLFVLAGGRGFTAVSLGKTSKNKWAVIKETPDLIPAVWYKRTAI